MRQAFAHQAEVTMRPDADVNAVGAAITMELCGHWEHDPPCPVAPLYTSADRQGDVVQIRTLFASDAEMEQQVRSRIDTALAAGSLPAQEPSQDTWQLHGSHADALTPAEMDHAARLLNN
ncbi:MAG: hypothetical protein ABI586_07020 [Candidatus Nanopelagicales bacterium]